MAGRSNRRERNHLPGSLPKSHAAYPRRLGRHRCHQHCRAGCLRPMTLATDGTVLRLGRSGPIRPLRALMRKLFRGQSRSERRAGGRKPQGLPIRTRSIAGEGLTRPSCVRPFCERFHGMREKFGIGGFGSTQPDRQRRRQIDTDAAPIGTRVSAAPPCDTGARWSARARAGR